MLLKLMSYHRLIFEMHNGDACHEFPQRRCKYLAPFVVKIGLGKKWK
jgi:hypothetical protein